MSKRLKIAVVILYVAAGIAVAYGLVYAFIPRLLPYHQRYLGVPFENLDAKVASLFLLIYRGVGAAIISVGAILAMLVRAFLTKGSRAAWWIILVGTMTLLIPLLFITRSVGSYAPWWGIGILILVVSGALAAAWKETSV